MDGELRQVKTQLLCGCDDSGCDLPRRGGRCACEMVLSVHDVRPNFSRSDLNFNEDSCYHKQV